MAYEFRRIDLRIFDFHLSLGPLVAAAQVNKPMAFLTDPDAYRQQFNAPPFVCGDFRIRPLRQKSRTYHHFWKYYTASDGDFDPWLLLVPFLCEPTSGKLSVAAPGKGVRAFARPATYLFPFGWSNTIEMSLQGKMDPATVQDYIGKLRNSKDGPFQLQGKDLGLSDVFKQYSAQLMKACFVKGTAAPDFRKVDRHILVGITHFDGDIAPYKSRDAAIPAMPAADRATFHSLLLGEAVDISRVVSAENSKEFLLTRYRGAGFALSYFEKGSLIFLQDSAKDPKNREALRCLLSNMLFCMMMMRALLNFHIWPDSQSADAHSLLGRARDSAKQRLLTIPDRYRSPLCRTWFQHYAPLTNLQSGDSKAS
jgi:hypothetical protein